jgi:hypothetical protein
MVELSTSWITRTHSFAHPFHYNILATTMIPAIFSSFATGNSTPVKHVSFQEKIDRIGTDGTVEHAVLKKAHSLEATSSLDFDFGLCRVADASFVPRKEEPERMVVSSYKKFAPRSQLQYIKRASL